MRLYIDDTSDQVVIEHSNWKISQESLFKIFPNPNKAYPYFGLLPPVVRYMSPIDSSGISYVLIEAKPRKHFIRWNGKVSHSSQPGMEYCHEINIPWHHWLLTFQRQSDGSQKLHSVDLAFSKTQITEMSHRFYMPYLMNVFAPGTYPFVLGKLCVDLDSIDQTISITRSLHDLYEDLTKMFWGGFFNIDIINGLTAYRFGEDDDVKDSISFEKIPEAILLKMDYLSQMSMDEVHDLLGRYVDGTADIYQNMKNFKQLVEYCSDNAGGYNFRRVLTDLDGS